MVALANEEVGRHFLLASPGDRGEAAGSSFCWCPLQGGLCVFALLSLDIATSRASGKHPCSHQCFSVVLVQHPRSQRRRGPGQRLARGRPMLSLLSLFNPSLKH